MPKRKSGKGSTEQGKARRKLADLAPKRVKGGDAATVKGGCGTGMSKDGQHL